MEPEDKQRAEMDEEALQPGLPEGAMFMRQLSSSAIFFIESSNPFRKCKVFDISQTNQVALTVERVPRGYRPYPGCMFDILSEPDNDKRFQDLCLFFRTLGSPGDKGRECGLLYTIIHLWPLIHVFKSDYVNTIKPYSASLIEFFIDAGMVECFMRLLSYCLRRPFLMIEFNRYVPYRILEFLSGSTHIDQPHRLAIIHKIFENKQKATDIFISYLNGGVSSLEAMVATSLLANMSSEVSVISWLLDHPDICAAVSRFIWDSHTDQYSSFRQHLDLQSVHQRALYARFVTNVDHTVVNSNITQLPRRTIRYALILLDNLCSHCAKTSTTEAIEPVLMAVVDKGLFDYIGDVTRGILLDYDDPTRRVPPDKLMLLISWSVFHLSGQERAMEHLQRLPYTRRDQPPYFSPWSFAKSRSLVSFLITHSLWFDDLGASSNATQGVVSLLRRSDKIAVEIIKFAGDLLFDLGHSIHHVTMPDDDGKTLPIKRAIFDVFLKLGGYSYLTLDTTIVPACKPAFEGPVPQCVKDVKEFCDRMLRESRLSKREQQRFVRCADSFKTEGNEFFQKNMFQEAIVCYTKALDLCPLTCVERRVTYYSNRAECYLQSNQPRAAIRDCTRALAQNPDTFKVRWRRAQALSQIGARHLAALDSFTIAHRNDKSVVSLLGRERWEELRDEHWRLWEHSFLHMAEHQLGPTQYRGYITRKYGLRVDPRTPPSSMHPYTGEPLFPVEEGCHFLH